MKHLEFNYYAEIDELGSVHIFILRDPFIFSPENRRLDMLVLSTTASQNLLELLTEGDNTEKESHATTRKN